MAPERQSVIINDRWYKNPKEKRRGRRSTFKPAYVAQARRLCLRGATEAQIADCFGVDRRTVKRWKKRHPEFRRALRAGKAARVAESHGRPAGGDRDQAVKTSDAAETGKDQAAEHVERCPLDPTATILWLKHRRPDLSRDKISNQQTRQTGAPIAIKDESEKPDLLDTARRIALILYQADKVKNNPDQEA